TKEMSIRSLLKKDKVEFVGTTDDPTDDLASHIALHKEGFEITVSPSFRPDKGLNLEKDEFLTWVGKLEQATNSSIETYDALLDALASRVDYFDENGCRSSDHGIDVMFYEQATKEQAAAVFQKRLLGEKLTAKEIEQYK